MSPWTRRRRPEGLIRGLCKDFSLLICWLISKIGIAPIFVNARAVSVEYDVWRIKMIDLSLRASTILDFFPAGLVFWFDIFFVIFCVFYNGDRQTKIYRIFQSYFCIGAPWIPVKNSILIFLKLARKVFTTKILALKKINFFFR